MTTHPPAADRTATVVPRSAPSPATERARDLARLLDAAFRVPGTRFRFGLDPILGLVPGLGDIVAGSFAFYLLVLGFRVGAPPVVLLRMFLNAGGDLLFGSVPLLGDLLDAGFKANLRNLALIERYLERPERTRRNSLILLIVLAVLLVALLTGVVAVVVVTVSAFLNWIV